MANHPDTVVICSGTLVSSWCWYCISYLCSATHSRAIQYTGDGVIISHWWHDSWM